MRGLWSCGLAACSGGETSLPERRLCRCASGLSRSGLRLSPGTVLGPWWPCRGTCPSSPASGEAATWWGRDPPQRPARTVGLRGGCAAGGLLPLRTAFPRGLPWPSVGSSRCWEAWRLPVVLLIFLFRNYAVLRFNKESKMGKVELIDT